MSGDRPAVLVVDGEAAPGGFDRGTATGDEARSGDRPRPRRVRTGGAARGDR